MLLTLVGMLIFVIFSQSTKELSSIVVILEGISILVIDKPINAYCPIEVTSYTLPSIRTLAGIVTELNSEYESSLITSTVFSDRILNFKGVSDSSTTGMFSQMVISLISSRSKLTVSPFFRLTHMLSANVGRHSANDRTSRSSLFFIFLLN